VCKQLIYCVIVTAEKSCTCAPGGSSGSNVMWTGWHTTGTSIMMLSSTDDPRTGTCRDTALYITCSLSYTVNDLNSQQLIAGKHTEINALNRQIREKGADKDGEKRQEVHDAPQFEEMEQPLVPRAGGRRRSWRNLWGARPGGGEPDAANLDTTVTATGHCHWSTGPRPNFADVIIDFSES
jgi:hypothetical protein